MIRFFTKTLREAIPNTFTKREAIPNTFTKREAKPGSSAGWPSVYWERGIIAIQIRLLFTIGTSQIGWTCIYFRTSHTTYRLSGMVDYAVDYERVRRGYEPPSSY